jgi:hypothetical protein
MMKMASLRLYSLLGGFGLASLALLANPTDAQACGGTFCDAQVPGPQQMQVDQTGENIMFVIDGNRVEAHIQIQYTGDPERFGWVIPVTNVPEVGVGSQALFDNLLAATVPSLTLTTQQETCDGGVGASAELGCAMADASENLGGSGGSTGFGSDGGDEGTGGGDGDDGGPDIIDRGFAGAFQYDVLQGGTIEGVTQWLEDAGYVQDDDAPPILENYLDDDFLFVAIKLRSGVGVEEIHPITIAYDGMEPCVPIRLTAIAAVPDMAIRAFFLGESRVAPKNYDHVTINQAKLDWLGVGTGTTGYNMAVALAIDETEDGHGFVTEYAGTSKTVSQANLTDNRWDADVFRDADWQDVIDLAEAQGLVNCFGDCSYPHPLIKGLLYEHFPPPYNVDHEAFYSNPFAYAQVYDEETWNPQGFADAYQAGIIDPGNRAIQILNEQEYLTRLYTAISPEEMTEDPLFHQNPDLPNVPKDYAATVWRACSTSGGPDWLELADGRVIAMSDGSVTPDFDDMPSAEKIETIPAEGSPLDVADNTPDIDEIIDEYNADFEIIETGGCNCRVLGKGAEGFLFVTFVFGSALWLRRRRR